MPKPVRLLVVDDKPTNISLLFEFLSQQGYEVLVAEEGETALDIARYEQPALILLDIMMPTMDGFETCHQLKINPKTAEIPVIFMTALSEAGDKVHGFAMGAVDYITKPFNHDELLSRIHTHVTLQQLQRDLQHKNQELMEKNAQLVQLNEEKNQFLSLAGRDFKHPLTTIDSTCELLKHHLKELTHEDIAQCLSVIETSSKQMHDLVCELMEVQALEVGRKVLHLMPIDIQLMVSMVLARYEQRAAEKTISVYYEPVAQPFMAMVDEKAIYQVLDNLVSNAIKYSPVKKSIWVRLYQDNQQVCCEVQDEGPGLSSADQQRLFQKFTRLTPRPTAEESSTGLGLFIVKRLVEAMHGQVWCHSTLDQGTTFCVALPVATSVTSALSTVESI